MDQHVEQITTVHELSEGSGGCFAMVAKMSAVLVGLGSAIFVGAMVAAALVSGS